MLFATLLAAAFASVTAPTSNSSTSVKLMLKTWVEKLASFEVARTVMLWLAAASRLSRLPSATVQTQTSDGAFGVCMPKARRLLSGSKLNEPMTPNGSCGGGVTSSKKSPCACHGG